MSDFNLTQTVRRVLRSATTADHFILAKEVLAEIPESEMAGCLEELLPHYVQRQAAQLREGYRRSAKVGALTMGESGGRSRGIDPGERFLSQIAPFDLRKFIRECDRGDCQHIAERYQQESDANGAKAERWRLLARKVKPGQTVGDLPISDVKAILFAE